MKHGIFALATLNFGIAGVVGEYGWINALCGLGLLAMGFVMAGVEIYDYATKASK
jgi:hypothetical protein